MPYDKRICKNRIILYLALVDLMKDKPYDSITVEEITEKAMVSRGTFYRHVSDKNQLLSFGISFHMDEVIEEMGALDSWDSESIFQIIDVFFYFLEKRKKLLESLFGPNAPDFVRPQIRGIIASYLKNNVFHECPEDILHFPQHFLSSLTTNILMGFIREWPVLSRKQRDYLIKCFYNFVSNGLSGFLNQDSLQKLV